MTTTAALLEELEAKASPKPWSHRLQRGDGPEVYKVGNAGHDIALIAKTVFEDEQQANATLTVLAANHLRTLVEAAEPKQDTDGSLVFQVRVRGLPGAPYPPKEVAWRAAEQMAKALRQYHDDPLITAQIEEPRALAALHTDLLDALQ